MELKLEKIKDILKKDQSSRKSEDIKLLSSIISDIKFFDSLKKYKQILRECSMYLTYEFIPKNRWVFKEGDFGEKFYILVKGEASVQISVRERLKTVQKEILVYKDGSSFGELALTDKKPRAASVYTKSDCHFAVLDKFNYNRILSSLLATQRNELIEFLKKQSYFKHLTKLSLLKLSYCFEEKELRKGDVLYREKDPIELIYCIREGEVKLSRNIKIEMIGETKPVTKATLMLKKHCWKKADIGILESGELIGINDIEKKVYSTTCVINSKTAKVLHISLNHFFKRMDNEDTLNVINHGKNMRNMLHQQNVNSATKILRDRIATPYKKLLFEETFSSSKDDLKALLEADKSKRRLSTGIERRNSSMKEELNRNKAKYLSFDCNLNRKEEFATSNRRVKTSLHNYRQKVATDQVDEQATHNKKTHVLSSSQNIEVDSSYSPKSYAPKKKNYNVEYIMAKMSPFGKNKTIVPMYKEDEIVNIHVKPKKDLSLRPNTPKNWSFMNINNSVRRPISVNSKHRNS